MAFSKKTWVDRISQYPNRRKLTDTTTSEEQIVTVSRDEGTVTTTGDVFNASTMNDLENRINSAFNNIENKVDGKPFLTAGTLSTTTAYGTITWTADISNYTQLQIYTWNPSTWTCYKNTINISELSSTAISKTLTLHTAVTVSVSLTSIGTTYYSGSWTGMPTIICVV